MTSTTVSNILNEYNEKVKQHETNQCLKSWNREHDYESIHSQHISTNIVEVEYICLYCNVIKYVYNYLEVSE